MLLATAEGYTVNEPTFQQRTNTLTSIALLSDFARADPWDYTSSPYRVSAPE